MVGPNKRSWRCMRTELSLTNILAVYRGTAFAAGAAGCLIVFTALEALIAGWLGARHAEVVLPVVAIAGLALLTIIVWGYFSRSAGFSQP